jgi:hypothetical protein
VSINAFSLLLIVLYTAPPGRDAVLLDDSLRDTVATFKWMERDTAVILNPGNLPPRIEISRYVKTTDFLQGASILSPCVQVRASIQIYADRACTRPWGALHATDSSCLVWVYDVVGNVRAGLNSDNEIANARDANSRFLGVSLIGKVDASVARKMTILYPDGTIYKVPEDKK